MGGYLSAWIFTPTLTTHSWAPKREGDPVSLSFLKFFIKVHLPSPNWGSALFKLRNKRQITNKKSQAVGSESPSVNDSSSAISI